MLKNLGKRIRQLRKEKGITLVELSRVTEVAQATLSRIETGTMIGTVESHEKIAEAIGVGLADLYADIDKRYDQISHQKKGEERKVTHQGKDIRVELLTLDSSKKKITPLLITLKHNSELDQEAQDRGVEKFVFVLEGSVKITVDKNEYPLDAEETLYFDASLPHSLKNTAQGTSRLLMSVSPSKI